MIVKYLENASKNRWALWGTFAAGFILPPFFFLFVPLAAIAAWREFRDEYGEVGLYWQKRAEEAVQVAETRLPTPVRQTASALG